MKTYRIAAIPGDGIGTEVVTAGTEVLEALMRHHFAFTLSNELAFSAALRHPAPDSDLMTNMQWCYETNLFANYAKGTKPGGFNGSVASLNGRPDDVTFNEETSKNYEIGMKSSWLENRLIANVSVFFLDAEDIQLTTPIQNSTTGAVTSIATNQGSGEIKGLELEARLAATENLTLGLTYALADTKFTEGCDDFQYTLTSGGGVYRSSNPASSFNPTGLGDCSIVGNPFPLAAKNTASFTADYSRPIRDGGMKLYVNGDISFTDKRAVQDGESVELNGRELLSVKDSHLSDYQRSLSWRPGPGGKLYLAYLRDPDGNKICALYRPAK